MANMANTEAPIDMEHAGGIVTVILAKDMELPAPYDTHPQVHPLLAVDLPQVRADLSLKIPSTTKLVVVGGEIPSGTYAVLRRVLDDRNLVYVSKRNPTALGDALRRTLTKKEDTPAPPLKQKLREPLEAAAASPNNVLNMRQPQARGAVATLLQEADLSKSSSEEGRRLFRIAQARGISTTVGSLTSGVAHLKRKGGRTETPKSLMTEQQRVLIVFDEAIDAGRMMIAKLEVVRDYVSKTEQESMKWGAKIREFQALAAMVSQDIKDES